MQIEALAETIVAMRRAATTEVDMKIETIVDALKAIDKIAGDMRETAKNLRDQAEASRVDPELFGWLHRMVVVTQDFGAHLATAEAMLPEKYRALSDR